MAKPDFSKYPPITDEQYRKAIAEMLLEKGKEEADVHDE